MKRRLIRGLALLVAVGGVVLFGVQRLVIADSPGTTLPGAKVVDPSALRDRPIEGDTWILDLVKERQWSQAELLVTYTRPEDEQVNVIAWGSGNFSENRVSDGFLYEAVVDRLQVVGGEDGFNVFDMRFNPCPQAPLGRAIVPDQGGPPLIEPKAGQFKFGRHSPYLWAWEDLQSIVEPRAERVEVTGEESLNGRDTYVVHISFRTDFKDEGLQRWAEGMRAGWTWWVDKGTGIVVQRSIGGFQDPVEVRIVGVDDQVRIPSFADLVIPVGNVNYRAYVGLDPDGGGRPPGPENEISEAVRSDGTTSLADVVDAYAPDNLEPPICSYGEPKP